MHQSESSRGDEEDSNSKSSIDKHIPREETEPSSTTQNSSILDQSIQSDDTPEAIGDSIVDSILSSVLPQALVNKGNGPIQSESDPKRPPTTTSLSQANLRRLLPTRSPSPNYASSETLKRPLPSGANTLLSEPTTAINLESVGNTSVTESDRADRLSTVPSTRSLQTQSILSGGYSSDDNNHDDNYVDQSHTQDEEDLQHVLNDLIRHEFPVTESSEAKPVSYLDLNIFKHSKIKNNRDTIGYDSRSESQPQVQRDAETGRDKNREEDFYNQYIELDKGDDEKSFHNKFKHFFILSSAGKPVYSMNGSDDIIIGYMGIITTIISTFEENIKEEIQSITISDDLKLVALNKNEIILVAITKIGYELMTPSTTDPEGNRQEEDTILVNQLKTLYNYLLSILSKPSLERNFHNRMNYDLRKVLTPLDFHNLDSLCMKMTYGLQARESSEDSGDKYLELGKTGFDFFMSQLLGSSLQNIKITNTTRTQLNNILLSCKKLKNQNGQVEKSDKLSSFFGLKNDSENEKNISEDLLFAFLTVSNKILSYMKPKNHNLTNEDISLLFSMIESTESHEESDDETSGDLWFPLCMPNFNQNGFLYVFVKKFYLGDYVELGPNDIDSSSTKNGGLPTSGPPITIILFSSNKNSFFEMQEISKYIIHKLIKHTSFKVKLYRELLISTKLSILHDIKVPVIKHFVYKVTKTNQYIMSDMIHYNGERNMNSCLQLVYFYSMLRNTKVTKVFKKVVPQNPGGTTTQNYTHNKKLTYSKWNNHVTGFMLSDDTFEFYCLCTEQINSRDLISHSLKVIKWCEKNYKRLFIGNGISF